MTEVHPPSSPLSLDSALFTGKVHGILATCYSNERPPRGVAGVMDWYFQGEISRCLRAGSLSGALGELTYLPLTKNQITYHLLLVGAGSASSAGMRKELPMELIQRVKKNLIQLKLQTVGLSRQDFGNPSVETLETLFAGAPVWITN